MSLLYAVVFASRCRSTHRRIALDALRRLRCESAQDWRNLLLRRHADYLGGAAAPDLEFKDYKNHVLHVREKDWGGAVEACQEWYRRTVRALKARDWKQAAWSAGVLSHYYVDPLQPFHTHQTEEENIIHLAVERSCAKSYALLRRTLERDLGGYPDIEAPTGEKWLAEMVKAGAMAANAHYELVIDHYDFDAGVAYPPAGLDRELKDAFASLTGHAIVGFARILDRAIAEAGVRPPKVGGGALQALWLTLEAPLQAMRNAAADKAEERAVEAQYQEYRRTGKVRGTLSEDEKTVRALHAAEVLKTPLSSLDAKWPREIGAKAGQGGRMRTGSSRQALRASGPAEAKPAARQRAKVIELEPLRPALEAVKADKPAKPPRTDAAPRELPAGAPLARREKVLPRFTLSGDAPVAHVVSIGAKAARRLEAAGVKTVADLLAVEAEACERRADDGEISVQAVRDWQAHALLLCTVPGLKAREAQALVACGVSAAQDLAQMDALELCNAVAEWGLSEDGQHAWGSAPASSADDVATWIARAKRVTKCGAPVAA
ncbi:MAG: DUF4332 domain-containing protein [Vitreimonas sp.]